MEDFSVKFMSSSTAKYCLPRRRREESVWMEFLNCAFVPCNLMVIGEGHFAWLTMCLSPCSFKAFLRQVYRSSHKF